MNQKQNSLEIIRFGCPERVQSQIPVYSMGYLGVNHQGYADTHLENGHDCPAGSKWRDIWGTCWHKELKVMMGFPVEYPLADIKAYKTYNFPDPNDERVIGKIYRAAEDFHDKDEYFLGGAHRDTLWEKSYMLTGMENMMEYFYTEADYAKEILHSIMNFQLGIAKHYVKTGVEIVFMSDDLGTQSNLLLGPDIINEFLVPEYKRIFDFYKSKGILIHFHSCGHVEPILDMFLALGVDILNPVQATANNLERLISVTQGKMALEGGISSGMLMDGDTEVIRDTIRDTIALLGRQGGYFCEPDQMMPYKQESLDAMYEAIQKFGKYPL